MVDMGRYAVPVRDVMVSPVEVARESDGLAAIDRTMKRLGISALPVLGSDDKLSGLITRENILCAGRVRYEEGRPAGLLGLPAGRVREVMSPTVEVVSPETTLARAAERMVTQDLHRLFVANESRVQGIVTTREMMLAVSRTRLRTPIGERARGPVAVVGYDAPISLAIDRLTASESRGIVVHDREFPIGAFTHREALASRDAPPDAIVEGFLDQALVIVPPGVPTHRVAGQAYATRATLVVVVDGTEILGILTGTDFARLVTEDG